MRLRAHGMDHRYVTLLLKTDFIWTCAGIKFRISEYLRKKTTIKFQFKNEISCICAGFNWIKVEKDFQNCCILFLLTFYPKVPTSIESGSCRMTREERKKGFGNRNLKVAVMPWHCSNGPFIRRYLENKRPRLQKKTQFHCSSRWLAAPSTGAGYVWVL